MRTVHSPETNSYSFILDEGEWYNATAQQQLAWQNQIMREGKEHGMGNLNILVSPDTMLSVSPVPNMHSVWAHVRRKSMTFSQAVRLIMDECDKYGLHHEVLSLFMDEFEAVFNRNEELCRAGQPQVTPDFAVMARNALWEWDI